MKRLVSAIGKNLPPTVKKKASKNTFIRMLYSPRPRLTFKTYLKLLFSPRISLSPYRRLWLLRKFSKIEKNVHCLSHSYDEYLVPAVKMLDSSFSKTKGIIVEAGAYKGGGTAKLSLVAKLTGRKLYVFDSFEGLPDNDEPSAKTDMGYECEFNEGDFTGSLREVKSAIKKYGDISVCEFVKGFYDTTMPDFHEPVAAVFCDVDLESSTKTCLKYMCPNMTANSYFFSQDAHIPLIQQLFANEKFWKKEVHLEKTPHFFRLTPRFGYFQKDTRNMCM